MNKNLKKIFSTTLMALAGASTAQMQTDPLNSQVSYLYHDATDNVVASNDSNSLNHLYRYTAYGMVSDAFKQKQTKSIDPDENRIPLQITENAFGYTGQRQDSATALISMGQGYRNYDPIIGQFAKGDSLSAFSVHHTYNGFAYGNANPISNSDPSGHFSLNTSSILGITGMGISLAAPFLMPINPSLSTGLLITGAGLNVGSSISILSKASATQLSGYAVSTVGMTLSTIGMFSSSFALQFGLSTLDNTLEGAAMPMMQGEGKFSFSSSWKSAVAGLPYALTLGLTSALINSKMFDAMGNHQIEALTEESNINISKMNIAKAFALGGARGAIGEIVRYETYNRISQRLNNQSENLGNLTINAALGFVTGGTTYLGGYLTNMYIKPQAGFGSKFDLPIELSTGIFNYGWPQQYTLPELEDNLERR
ncbi:MAG: RHS repeat-associated core domain-containing protein [Francisellaceae bacterium]